MSCCSNPCLYHRLAPNSLTVHKPGHLGSLRARGGQCTARRIPTLPRYYGNAAAMLSPMLMTYSNHFLEGSHAVLNGSQKKLKPMEKCKKKPLHPRGKDLTGCPQPPRHFMKHRAVPFAYRSVFFLLPFCNIQDPFPCLVTSICSGRITGEQSINTTPAHPSAEYEISTAAFT